MKKVIGIILLILGGLLVGFIYNNPQYLAQKALNILIKKKRSSDNELEFKKFELKNINVPDLTISLSSTNSDKNTLSLSGKIKASYNLKASPPVLVLSSEGVTFNHKGIHYKNARGAFNILSLSEMTLNKESKVNIEQIHLGVALNKVSFTFNIPRPDLYTFKKASAEIFGGKIAVELLEYNSKRATNSFILKFHKLDLEKILKLTGQNQVEAYGLVSGALPIKISPKGIRVSDGTLYSHEPGGKIRYGYSENTPSPQAQDIQSLVAKALENYHYSEMTAKISYDYNGETLISAKLIGKNPDLNKGQRINVNLNVEQNLLSLMRSLQAKSKIEKKIEKRFGGG